MIHITQAVPGKIGMDKNGNLVMLFCIISTLTGALLMRYIIEKPALVVRDKVLKRCKKLK